MHITDRVIKLGGVFLGLDGLGLGNRWFQGRTHVQRRGRMMGVLWLRLLKLFGFDVDVTVAWLVDPWKGGCHFVLTWEM